MDISGVNCYKYYMKVSAQKPLLSYLNEFKVILDKYTPSNECQELFSSVPMVLLVGPTAAGRNTLINLLVKSGRYHMIVSDSTRAPRVVNGKKEQNGKVYWFKSEKEVLEGLRRGEYIEAALIHNQQVSGANIAEIQKAHKEGKIALKEIEVNGAATYRTYKPDVLCIFLLPPSFEVWMKRIKARGGIDDADLHRRIVSAVNEITLALSVDYYQFVVNYEIHEATAAVDEIANGRAIDKAKQQIGRDHAEQLIIDVQLYLNS